MEKTLKITNVLSDPTRFYIYQYITKKHSDVTVQEIADHFNIHPNVARLHLSKLEDVNMLVSETKKTGKGGRPSRLYRLSDKVIELTFPFRDYQLLSKMTIESLALLGEEGKRALYATGKKFGKKFIEEEIVKNQNMNEISFEDKLQLLKEAAMTAGFCPEIEANNEQTKIYFQIYNCPFKEIANEQSEMVCKAHYEFLKGVVEGLFQSVELIEKDNMLFNSSSCCYHINVTN